MDRIERAEAMVEAYREIAGHGLSDEEAAGDLIADLMHYADVIEADDGDPVGAQVLIQRAEIHYYAERGA